MKRKEPKLPGDFINVTAAVRKLRDAGYEAWVKDRTLLFRNAQKNDAGQLTITSDLRVDGAFFRSDVFLN